jgi:hypothetical protein
MGGIGASQGAVDDEDHPSRQTWAVKIRRWLAEIVQAVMSPWR